MLLLSNVLDNRRRSEAQISQNSRQHKRMLGVGHYFNRSAHPGLRPEAELRSVHQVAQFSNILFV